jgi:hypothetical protein
MCRELKKERRVEAQGKDEKKGNGKRGKGT